MGKYYLYLVIFIRLILWFWGTQQTRFLYPVFPYLSFATADILLGLQGKLSERMSRIVSITLLSAPLIVVINRLCFAIITILQPWNLWLGIENTELFVERIVPSYPIIRYINQELPADSKVIFLWEGQSYYCKQKCIPDSDHMNWLEILRASEWKLPKIQNYLSENRIQYLLIGKDTINFLIYHNPKGMQKKSFEFLMNIFLQKCGHMIQENENTALYWLNCSQ